MFTKQDEIAIRVAAPGILGSGTAEEGNSG